MCFSLPMSIATIEQELSDLKKRVNSLESKLEPAPKGAWRELIGSQEDDELFREATRLGAEWRAEANTEGK